MDQITQAINKETLKAFTKTLEQYKAGKSHTEQRIVQSENWWKLRNSSEEKKETNIGADGGFKSVSGWLHNVIVAKHADAMEAFPEPNILPREQADRAEALVLSSIVPCILEQNNFEATYSDVMWQKLKTGTGVYKVMWDSTKLNGLGDIAIERCNILNLFWEPGVTDIQKSRYFFHTELHDKELLKEKYPQLANKLKGQSFTQTKFLYDDTVNTADKATVIEVYYRKRGLLHYCKYVEDEILFASENDPTMAEKGFYDHGKFPYVFDALYPIEGSPCGYGYVDVCRNPQTEIDLLKTNFIKNAAVGSVPRYFSRIDGSVNEEEFLDLSKPIVHVNGNLGEDSLRLIQHNSLDGNYISVLDRTIQELRETSGNTETSTGNIQSGVTAASAIAALQEASGKGSRDSTQTSYRAYSELVELCIELIRQFYDMPRKFRIIGNYGAEQFVSYTNSHLKPQPLGQSFGTDMGMRLPVFDIKISAQKKNVYTKVSQNELALQFYKMGMFNPQMVDQSLMCIGMMEFDGKDELMQQISRNGTIMQKLVQYMQLALALAQENRPDLVPGLSQDVMAVMNGGVPSTPSAGTSLVESDNIAGIGKEEPAVAKRARERSSNSAQPNEGGVIRDRD